MCKGRFSLLGIGEIQVLQLRTPALGGGGVADPLVQRHQGGEDVAVAGGAAVRRLERLMASARWPAVSSASAYT